MHRLSEVDIAGNKDDEAGAVGQGVLQDVLQEADIRCPGLSARHIPRDSPCSAELLPRVVRKSAHITIYIEGNLGCPHCSKGICNRIADEPDAVEVGASAGDRAVLNVPEETQRAG